MVEETNREADATSVTRQVVAISAGASHTVALLSDNTVCSWGRGEDGQLGHGDAEERHTPTEIASLDSSDVSSVSSGADHTTAYSTKKNIVWSWGWGDFGRLGHGNSTDLFVPQPVAALGGLPIIQIACGDCHCLAVTEGGEVLSWGRNQNGQLGLGNTEDGLIPQRVTAFSGTNMLMVAAGAEHTAAISADGRLYGWGWGRYGNLGLGDRKDRLVPEEVAKIGDEKMTMVACGWRHTITVSASGKIYTYGWSKYGQLGHGDYEDHLVPFAVEALKSHTISKIAGGWRHTVALDSDGSLYAWGWNKFGQVGVGNTDDQNSPQLLLSLPEPVSLVSCGWRHTLAVTTKGNVFSWGRGTNGQLGHGDCQDRNLPKMLKALSVDGEACQKLAQASHESANGSSWVSPSERYAVVPDESAAPKMDIVGTEGGDASVPNTDTKRVRMR